MKKFFATFFVLSLVLIPALNLALPVMAATGPDLWGDQQDDIQAELGYDEPRDPRLIAATIIKVLLSFLGIIAVILIIWAGFTWMTAAGNDEKIETARKILIAAVIGLIIVLSAWGIADFVLTKVRDATV